MDVESSSIRRAVSVRRVMSFDWRVRVVIVVGGGGPLTGWLGIIRRGAQQSDGKRANRRLE